MNWLSPLTALYAGAVTVPLLLLLYFLKLKRRERTVASTLLWKRAVQDLNVNAPFQKLRRSILLLLQLLALLAIVAALGGPTLLLRSLDTPRYVLLIDNSASMNATDVKPTRLESAKKQAKTFIESTTEKSFASIARKLPQIMVITLNDSAKVVCNFTSDKNQLLSAIDAIKPADGGTNLGQALALARAFCQGPESQTDSADKAQAANLLLFSDGGIRDAQNLSVMADEMTYHAIGESSDNIGITAMNARRSFENAEQVNVFATLTNYNDAEVTTDIELSINGDLKAVKTITIAPKKVDAATGDQVLGQSSVDFEVSSLSFGVIELRLLRKDVLTADNAAWSAIAAPRDIKVLFVSDGNPVLESALAACEQIELFKATRGEFAAMDKQAMEITRPYDIIVLDGHDGAAVGRGCYLVFGKPPQGIGAEAVDQEKNQFVVDYRARHPVLKYVNLDNLFVAECYKMDFPREGEVLAEFDKTVAIGTVRKAGSTYLLAGFDVMETNWPFEPGFVLFIYNASSYLAEDAGLAEKTELKVAEPVILEGLEAGAEAVFAGPGYGDETISVIESGKLRLPVMERVGLYSLEFADGRRRTFAVNLLDDSESDISPKMQLSLTGRTLDAKDSVLRRFNQPLWPYIVAAVLCLVCIEWFVYNRKVRI